MIELDVICFKNYDCKAAFESKKGEKQMQAKAFKTDKGFLPRKKI